MTNDRIDVNTLAAVYGNGSELYGEIWSPVILPPALSLVSRLDLSQARCVLDVGAGTGSLTPALRQAAPHAHVVSIDPSLDMLRLAPIEHGTSRASGDAMALPIGDAQAHVVVLAYVLFHLPDPEVGMREAHRVLCAEGQVGTITWVRREGPPRAFQIWDQVLERN